jgi:hypothetical protein
MTSRTQYRRSLRAARSAWGVESGRHCFGGQRALEIGPGTDKSGAPAEARKGGLGVT